MRRSSLPSVALALLVLVPVPSAAQRVTWLNASLGLEQVAQHNPGQSAYTYSGIGSALSLGLERESATRVFDVRLDYGSGGLNSSVTGASAKRIAGALDLRYLRVLTSHFAGAEWMAGADLGTYADVVRQTYSLYATDDAFGYLDIGAGAALRTAFHVPRGAVTNDFAVPVLSLVDLPYTDARMNGPDVHLRFASAGTLHAADDAVTYRAGRDDETNVSWTYRVRYFQYTLGSTRRFARQSLSATFNVPVGKSHR